MTEVEERSSGLTAEQIAGRLRHGWKIDREERDVVFLSRWGIKATVMRDGAMFFSFRKGLLTVTTDWTTIWSSNRDTLYLMLVEIAKEKLK